MTDFATAALGYPTALYTALLAAVLFYWLLAMIGLIDFETGGLDLDLDIDGPAEGIGAIASYMVAFGLGGVPFSVVVSLLVLLAWTFCALYALWLHPLVPTDLLRAVAGTGALLASLVLAVPITAALVRPLRKLFVTHGAVSNAALVGSTCRVLTRSVDERFGRAEVASRGASYNIRVWATSPNTLARGSTARIVDYDPEHARYQIEAEP